MTKFDAIVQFYQDHPWLTLILIVAILVYAAGKK